MMKQLQDTSMKVLIMVALALIVQMTPTSVFAQSSVSGTVTSSDDGGNLPGVSIVVKGTTIGTTTDQNGKFALQVSDANAVLVFSFIGYMTREIPVGNQTTIDVSLEADIETLSEVIVVGYGETKKASLTSAITSVKGKEFVKSPQPNFSNSFAGRVSGVVANTATGEPGSDNARLLIRGQSNLSGTNSPLIVIDGVAGRLGGLERLDPNDIESVSVLKDASAAIYGSQAANGVILVTTKRGTVATGPVFNFTYNLGFAKPTRLPEMADASSYAAILNEINYYRSPAGGMNQIYSDAEVAKFGDGSDPINYPNSDWIGSVMKPYSLQDQQNLSIGGGGSDVQYFVSLGRRHQDGIYEGTNLDYTQWNIRSNVDINITKDLKIGVDLAARQEDRVFPVESAGSIFRSAFRTYPTMAVYYPGGLPSPGIENGLNPVVIATSEAGFDEQPKTVLNTLLNFDYKLPFAKGFSVKGFYALDRTYESRKYFRKPWTVYQVNNSGPEPTFDPVVRGPITPELTERQRNEVLKTANLSLNYENTFGSTYFKAFLAYEQNAIDANWFETFRRGFLSPQIPEIDMGGSAPEERSNSGNSSRFTRRNYFGRFAAEYKSKLMAEFQFRYDGSSTFHGADKQFGFFPSVSLGWRLTEESWFDVAALDNLKLRASYGQLGNDRVPQFQYLNTFNMRSANYVLDGVPVPTFGIDQLANTNITWETANKLDIGIEATLFEDWTLELDYFHETRVDMLYKRSTSIPWVSGIVDEYPDQPIIPDENFAEAKNGGFEVQLGYNHTFGGELRMNLTGNFTYNKSEVIYIGEPDGMPQHQKLEGHPIGSQLLYQTQGIFNNAEELTQYPKVPGNQPGDLIYLDYDDNGAIDANDRVREDLSNVPQIIYGFTGSLMFKNFDFMVLLQGQARSVQYVLTEAGEVGNYFKSWADNRWSPGNPDGTYPRVDVRTSSSINGALYKNDFWLYNTSFLRIKNIELGYNFPANIAEKVKLSSARLYVSAYNLATFSKVKDFDPEGTSESAQFYPQQQIFNIGVNLKF